MNKWLSLPELMQRWQTDLIENVFETIRAGLPVYEYIDVGGTPDALELRPKDFMDRFQAVPPAWEKPAWATGIKPLRSGDVRFLVDDVETFEQAHDGARRSTRQDSGETINHAVEITMLLKSPGCLTST